MRLHVQRQFQSPDRLQQSIYRRHVAHPGDVTARSCQTFYQAERNRIAGNAFIDNRNQVKYVGTRHIEWSDEGRGNYWSDNTAFDIDGDGVSDRPYKPNGLVDQIVWRHPLAKLLLSSPAVQILRWAQAEFPGLYPGGVVDSAPLMRSPLAAPAGAANPIEPVRGDG